MPQVFFDSTAVLQQSFLIFKFQKRGTKYHWGDLCSFDEAPLTCKFWRLRHLVSYPLCLGFGNAFLCHLLFWSHSLAHFVFFHMCPCAGLKLYSRMQLETKCCILVCYLSQCFCSDETLRNLIFREVSLAALLFRIHLHLNILWSSLMMISALLLLAKVNRTFYYYEVERINKAFLITG